MASFAKYIRLVLGALAFLLVVGASAPSNAQLVNPTASSVKEQQLLNALGAGGSVGGRVSIPDQKSGTLIQPGGRDWRQFHEVTLRWIGAIAILGMLVLLVVFYLVRGQVKLESGKPQDRSSRETLTNAYPAAHREENRQQRKHSDNGDAADDR